MPADLQTIVQRMIDAGESEDDIAAVIREYRPTSTPTTPAVATAIGAAKLAPAVVSMVNKVAAPAAGLAQMKGLTPAIATYDAATNVAEGNYGRAAKAATVGAVTAAAPKVASMVQQSTNPTVQRMVQFGGKMLPMDTVPGGMVARGAGWLSRMAGTASLPLMLASSLYDTYQGGQAHAAKLDDPNLSQAEKDEILRQLHSHGGF